MDKLEWAVDSVDGKTFEKIAGEILRHEGYSVHESGIIGADGGWDARVEIDGRKGIGHASVRNDWRTKLREDAEKVEVLEEDGDVSFDTLVYLTNQHVGGQQEIELQDEIEDEYGWDLRVLHRRDVIGITGNERPDLAERHFGFNPKRQDDHIDRIIELRDDRLNIISNREKIATDLKDGPAAVVHLIPNGVFSGNYVDRSDDLPNLARFGRLNRNHATETVGKGKIEANSAPGQPVSTYTYLRRDGLFEGVDTWVFREDDNGGLLLNNARDATESFDCKVAITVQAGIRELKEMGVTGTVFCFVSLLDVKGTTISYEKRIVGTSSQQPLRADQYTTDMVEVPLDETAVVDSLRGPLTEIWQEIGWNGNLHYDEDGEWVGPVIRFSDIGVFPADADAD
ncbi:hypothetical protein ELS19_17610 [Halogeometricum borinquense]|uniref:Restriction endonuclease n=1 Tax=Halogeometricum borinquense TaxID=60847 RepID=A0A482SXU4_9EURY|nr:hypothetical protein [Halogeometricum borinquense]RYJ08368.1 hypothetical protein ELS19_17610 [Halogeometricum borinquense]